MLILVGCEESQEVTKALRMAGHEAYSCDLQECSGGRPEWHLQMDVFKAIESREWDAGVFFPECTYLTVSSNAWNKDQKPTKNGIPVGAERRELTEQAVDFFIRLYESDIPMVAIENPVGIMSTRLRRPDQYIHPWQFGHGEKKKTGLWLRGLPKLVPTKVVSGREERILNMSPSADRKKKRSKTYSGIASAMACQWFKDSDYREQGELPLKYDLDFSIDTTG